MGLEHELLELNTAYQNSREDVLMLQDRIQQLEQLVSDAQWHMELYHAVIENSAGLSYEVRAPRLPQIEAWQQRAKELLGSE